MGEGGGMGRGRGWKRGTLFFCVSSPRNDPNCHDATAPKSGEMGCVEEANVRSVNFEKHIPGIYVRYFFFVEILCLFAFSSVCFALFFFLVRSPSLACVLSPAIN